MPSLTAKDRAPLCLFSYEDGRRCRTPRINSHPHFCFYHAQKESQSQAAESLAKDLDYFFSGEYLSACDLSTALGRLVPAVIRGQIKPRLARTVAYMLQTQLQAIHLAQHEYINAFGTDGWRDAVRTSVDANYDHASPPAPADAAELAPTEANLAEPEPIPTLPTHVQPSTQSAHAKSVGAGLARPAAPRATSENAGLARPTRPTPPDRTTTPPPSPQSQSTARPPLPPSPAARPSPAATETALAIARNIFPERPNTAPTLSETPAAASAPPTNTATPTQTVQPTHLTPTPSEPPTQRRQPGVPSRDPYAVHFDHNYRLLIDGKPW